MTRKEMIDFCVWARSYLEDVPEEVVRQCEQKTFEGMSDEELRKEADWFDEVVGK